MVQNRVTTVAASFPTCRLWTRQVENLPPQSCYPENGRIEPCRNSCIFVAAYGRKSRPCGGGVLDTSAYLSMTYRLLAGGKRGQFGNDDFPGDESGQCGLSYVVFLFGFARRATKTACSALFSPCWSTARTAFKSLRSNAAGSSRRPGNILLRRMPLLSARSGRYCFLWSTNQSTASSRTRQTTYSRTPLR